jgi:hypothetical protein
MREFEREFLIRLAPVYLACRWKVMGHPLQGWPYKSDFQFDLLGMVDYGWEMRLMCKERMQEK